MIFKDIYTDTNGIVHELDNRIFSDVVNFKIQKLKEDANKEILKFCPEFKQRNAALGILSTEETLFIKNTIERVRIKCHQLEQQVHSISWDGRESTRAKACDDVFNVQWYFD